MELKYNILVIRLKCGTPLRVLVKGTRSNLSYLFNQRDKYDLFNFAKAKYDEKKTQTV